MKKIKYIILFILVSICCGCSYFYASTTRNIRHSGFAIASGTFKCDAVFEKKEVNDKIKFYIGNFMISENGYIYETNLGRVYSNDMNCRKPDFSHKIEAVFDTNVMKDTEGNYYYLSGANNVTPYSKVSELDSNYSLYDILLRDDDVVKASATGTNEFYVLKEDGNVYLYTVIKNNASNTYIVDKINMIYSSNDFGSKIVDFNYNGNSTATYVRTEKSIFKMQVTNSEECNKYADVACKYEMMEDEKLTLAKDSILAYSGTSLITTYGKIFNVTN